MEEKAPVETPKAGENTPQKPAKTKFVWTWSSFFHSFLWLAILLFAIDLASKWIIQLNYHPDSSRGVTVIPNFFYLYLTHNTKAAFGDWMGLGDDVLWIRIVLAIVSWVMSGVIGYYWYQHLNKKDYLIDSVFALALAGALGNAIDRTFYYQAVVGFDGVIDFFCFYIFGINQAPFAIFNVADACLTIAIAMAIVILLVRSIQESRKQN